MDNETIIWKVLSGLVQSKKLNLYMNFLRVFIFLFFLFCVCVFCFLFSFVLFIVGFIIFLLYLLITSYFICRWMVQ